MIKRLFVFFFIIFCTVAVKAQINLVPNPSFEIHSNCPNNDNQVDFATGWSGCANTPDYFNSCDTIVPDFSVPNNWGGYQQAATGNAYCGIGTYASYFPETREFIVSQLNTPLTIGTKYYVSFKTNLSLFYSTYFNTASDKLGALFSTIPYNATNWAPITNFAHIYSTSILTDTTNWMLVTGSFIADSSYSHIMIGNFFDDANTDTLVFSQGTSCGFPTCQTAYYFIDDVCVSTDSLLCSNITSNAGLIPESQILIYPNPTSEALFVSISDNNLRNKKCSIQINNAMGYECYTSKGLSEKNKIDLTALPFGIYYITIQIGDNIYRKKVIKN